MEENILQFEIWCHWVRTRQKVPQFFLLFQIIFVCCSELVRPLKGLDCARTRIISFVCRITNIEEKPKPANSSSAVASAAKFNIAPVRWQHPSHVAIVPTESKGKTEGNMWEL
jgi:hypothetical protein